MAVYMAMFSKDPGLRHDARVCMIIAIVMGSTCRSAMELPGNKRHALFIPDFVALMMGDDRMKSTFTPNKLRR